MKQKEIEEKESKTRTSEPRIISFSSADLNGVVAVPKKFRKFRKERQFIVFAENPQRSALTEIKLV